MRESATSVYVGLCNNDYLYVLEERAMGLMVMGR